MSVEFELEAAHYQGAWTWLNVDAYSDRAIVEMSNNMGDEAGATFTADELRRLRRFLEHCYPANEDGPHDPDPWTRPAEWAHDWSDITMLPS